MEIDIVAFERDLSEGRVLEAVGRWTGDFFEGAEDIGGDGFRRWLQNERAALHKQLGAAMERLIGDAELAGDWAGAAAWAQRWAAALPFAEAPHLRLIEALRMSGRSGDALKAHAAFVTRVRTALDVEPSAEFLRLGGGLADGVRDEVVEIEDALPGAIVVDRPRAVGVATLDENERAHIRKALAVTGGKIHGPRGAANILDINPSTLRSRMEKLGTEAA